MTEEERQASIEIDAAMRCFDPPAEDPQIPEKPEPGKPEAEPEQVEAGERPGEEEHLQAGDQQVEGSPDWERPISVLRWFGQEILRLTRRKESLPRLRALSGALDCWGRLVRLSADTAELAQIREELAALKREVEAERWTGPQGVVKS